MFFGRDLRKEEELQLRTLPAHGACNSSYRWDEEYFVYSLGPLAMESLSGRSVVNDIGTRFHAEGRNRPLANRSLEEFDARPSGLHLPAGLVVKRIDTKRINRVAWKIVRGLYFRHIGRYLPDRRRAFKLFGPTEAPPELYSDVLAQPPLGDHPTVLDYKRLWLGREDRAVEVWGLLFWDKLIGFLTFHALECRCDNCESSQGAA
jgi:hypothetical protein